MKKDKGRIFWIDNVRATMVLFVVCFHYIYTPQGFVCFVYPFTLPFFFAISGYFLKYNKENLVVFLRKKVGTYLPIIIFNAVIACILEGITYESILKIIKKIIFQIYGCESLWFIACTMIVQLLMYFTVKICKGHANKTLAICICYFIVGTLWTQFIKIKLVWSIDIAFMQMLFAGLGYWFKKKEKKAMKIINKAMPWGIIGYCILILLFPNCDIHRREYSCIWLYPIQALFGVLVFTCLFKKRCNVQIPIVTYLGKNSLYVYAFHGYVLSVYNRLLEQVFIINLEKRYILLTIGAVGFSTISLYFGCKIWFMLKKLFKRKKRT